ncbi:phosphotransferase [Streptomyces sp. NPDC058653]|uniref:phosphotransferase n=1 Tax=Streptomyces sp. NPDC058653 TaxID=3346576 RepID=UPI00365B640D
MRPITSGAANRAYRLGSDLVSRVARTEEFVADLVKEAAVIPVARAAGVRTPALVTFDGSRTDAAAPRRPVEGLLADGTLDAEARARAEWLVRPSCGADPR